MDEKKCDALAAVLKTLYHNDLVSCVIYGSYARGTATPESDLDICIVADNLPAGRMPRVRQFDAVEDQIQRIFAPVMLISPIFKTPAEALRGSPLFWDMVDRSVVVYDRNDFFRTLLASTAKTLTDNGAYRVTRGNAWYWVLKKDFQPGEIVKL